jgi:DNA replication protein DnaC
LVCAPSSTKWPQQAAAQHWSYTPFLGCLLDAELRVSHRRTVELTLQFVHFPYLKGLDGFDFAVQPGIDRRLIEELATGRFLYEGRNLIMLEPPVVGKTHLAIALGVITTELGHRVYFTSALSQASSGLTEACMSDWNHPLLL